MGPVDYAYVILTLCIYAHSQAYTSYRVRMIFEFTYTTKQEQDKTYDGSTCLMSGEVGLGLFVTVGWPRAAMVAIRDLAKAFHHTFLQQEPVQQRYIVHCGIVARVKMQIRLNRPTKGYTQLSLSLSFPLASCQ